MGVKLKKWLEYNQDDEKSQQVFYNMSNTMKYIHEHGYCIKTFNLNEIEILDLEKLNPIQYNTVIKMNNENEYELMREDIYNLAFMQIGIYTNTLNILKPQFLKEEFDSFIPLLPERDIPYFRGIVERGANVYYSDFVDAKREQEISGLQQNTTESRSNSLQKKKVTAAGVAFANKETEKLYSEIEKTEAAYINFLIYPIIMVVIGMIISLILAITT